MFDLNPAEQEALDVIFPESVEPEADTEEGQALVEESAPEPVEQEPEVVADVVLEPIPAEAPEPVQDTDNDYADLGTSSDGLVPIYVSSEGLDTLNKKGKKYLYGSVNGNYWEFPCDEQAMVTPEVFEVANAINQRRKNPTGFDSTLNRRPGV